MNRQMLVGAVLGVVLLLSSCGDDSPTTVAGTQERSYDGPETEAEAYAAATFSDPTTIDNRFLPLIPGQRFSYEGTTLDDGEYLDHLVVTTVTDLTKVIDGVETVVIWDQDFSDGELVETELAFFAQDDAGNVWRMGEYPEEYEDGELVEAPAWVVGHEDALAGIAMMADPQRLSRSYSQGWGPEVDFIDRGSVSRLGEATCVPAGCYIDVLVVDEFNVDEPGAFQTKWFEAGLGNVRVGWRGADEGQEDLELVEWVRLSPEAMGEARVAAYALEDSAYEQSEMYLQTPPLSGSSDTADPGLESATTEPDDITDDAGTGETVGDEPIFEAFDSTVFSNSTSISNEWLPLIPGNRLVLDGVTLEEGETLDHRIEFIVTDLTKVIGGVETVVAWIEDYSEDELVEAELAFYAQDDDGNVWFFGEYPEEYEDGEFVDAPAWIHGIEEAQAGLKMYADPEFGTPAYFQGWGPAVEWSDFGKVDAVGQETCTELDCYDDVLIVAESSLDEEDIFQLKSYAKGVGNIEVGWRGETDSKEELGVREFGPVSSEELESYRQLAMAMEAHAYEVSPDVYGETEPLM